jgi:hypothetical protein
MSEPQDYQKEIGIQDKKRLEKKINAFCEEYFASKLTPSGKSLAISVVLDTLMTAYIERAIGAAQTDFVGSLRFKLRFYRYVNALINLYWPRVEREMRQRRPKIGS